MRSAVSEVGRSGSNVASAHRADTPRIDALRFFQTLYAAAPRDALVEVRLLASHGWGIGGDNQYWAPVAQVLDATTDDLDDLLSVGQRVNVYVGVNPRMRERGGTEDVACVVAIIADVDVGGDKANATRTGALDRIRGCPLPPSAIVSSGGGYQLYFFLREPVTPPFDDAVSVGERLAEHFDGDNVSDPPRILRVPGTFNHKQSVPRPVELVELHADRRYLLGDFDFLPPPAASTLKKEKSSSRRTRPLSTGAPAGAVVAFLAATPFEFDHKDNAHVIADLCPACTADDVARAGAEPGSAHLVPASFELRCKRAKCPASAANGGFRANDWLRMFARNAAPLLAPALAAARGQTNKARALSDLGRHVAAERVSLDELAATIRQELHLWETPQLKVIVTPCGAGKTHTMAHEIVQMQLYGWLHPTHKQGDDVHRILAQYVTRRRGITAPCPMPCHYKTLVRELQAAGRAARDICGHCDRRRGCLARQTKDGTGIAELAPHAMVEAVRSSIGEGELMIFDEEPELTTAVCITRAEIAKALTHMHIYERPELWRSLLRFAAHQLDGGSLSDFREAYFDFDPESWIGEPKEKTSPVVEAAEHAAPYCGLTPQELDQMSNDDRTAALHTERIVGALYQAAKDGWEVTPLGIRARSVSPQLLDLATHGGIVLTATPRREAFEAVVRQVNPTSVVQWVELRAADADLTHRTMLYAADMNRGQLAPRGGEVAWQRIERHLSAVIKRLDETAPKHWEGLLVMAKALIDSVERAPRSVQKLIRRFTHRAHYGALRGLNTYKRCDVFVTFGDWYHYKPEVEHEAAFLALDPHDSMRERFAAELDQVHGRARNPRREKPVWHLRVGAVPPRSWRSDDGVEFVELALGRPAVPRDHEASREVGFLVDRLGSIRKAQRATGFSKSAIHRWASGKRTPPPKGLEALRAAVARLEREKQEVKRPRKSLKGRGIK